MVEQRVDVVLVVGVVLVRHFGVDESPLGQHEEVRFPLQVVLILHAEIDDMHDSTTLESELSEVDPGYEISKPAI